MAFEPLLTGGVVALALGAIEVAKYAVIKRNLNGKPQSNGRCGFDRDAAMSLTRLHELHDRTDGEGRPLWYFPRTEFTRLIAATEEQTELLRKICRHL